MKVFLGSVMLVGALTFALLFLFLGDKRPIERHYVQGMYPRSQRHFGDYLDPFTDQGLREIRSDRMERSAFYIVTAAGTSATSTIWASTGATISYSCVHVPMTTAVSTRQ